MFAKKGMCTMNNEGNFFVKLNCKNIDSIRSLIVDRPIKDIDQKEKYIMCAGKYDKNGWTIVFRARTYQEAEKLASLNPFEYRRSKVS
ncbi:hypothetical protein CNEONATNEC26_00035 [Clostridium neonatale]|nr:hypothetical protein CNEONATNEC26_00035 [Clostridium neonatale]SUQ44103.1 hypothetical protein CNEONATNEC32_00032 [Clostridium neonatale]